MGTKFLNIVAEHFVKQGNEFCIVTSAKNMISSLYKSDKWFCTNYNQTTTTNKKIKGLNKTVRSDCLCGRFSYKTKRYK